MKNKRIRTENNLTKPTIIPTTTTDSTKFSENSEVSEFTSSVENKYTTQTPNNSFLTTNNVRFISQDSSTSNFNLANPSHHDELPIANKLLLVNGVLDTNLSSKKEIDLSVQSSSNSNTFDQTSIRTNNEVNLFAQNELKQKNNDLAVINRQNKRKAIFTGTKETNIQLSKKLKVWKWERFLGNTDVPAPKELKEWITSKTPNDRETLEEIIETLSKALDVSIVEAEKIYYDNKTEFNLSLNQEHNENDKTLEEYQSTTRRTIYTGCKETNNKLSLAILEWKCSRNKSEMMPDIPKELHDWIYEVSKKNHNKDEEYINILRNTLCVSKADADKIYYDNKAELFEFTNEESNFNFGSVSFFDYDLNYDSQFDTSCNVNCSNSINYDKKEIHEQNTPNNLVDELKTILNDQVNKDNESNIDLTVNIVHDDLVLEFQNSFKDDVFQDYLDSCTH